MAQAERKDVPWRERATPLEHCGEPMACMAWQSHPIVDCVQVTWRCKCGHVIEAFASTWDAE